MIRRISDWLRRISKVRVASASLGIFLLFSAIALPIQSKQTESYTGEAGSPDMSFYYTAEDLYRMAEAYGEQGRHAYVKARFTFDLIWPIVYTLFLCTAISWFFMQAFSANSSLQRANIIPLLGMVFDYFENISTSVVMLRYPNQTVLFDSLASVFTLLKWFFIGISFLFLFAGIVAAVLRWVTKSDRKI